MSPKSVPPKANPGPSTFYHKKLIFFYINNAYQILLTIFLSGNVSIPLPLHLCCFDDSCPTIDL